MNVTLRTPVESDWPSILDVAHAAAPWAGDRNREWLHNRQQFDHQTWRRCHYLAQDIATQQIIGYGSIEEGPQPKVFRVFVVMSPERLNGGLGQYVFDRLDTDLEALNAVAAWVREEARDAALLSFFAQHAFAETSRARLRDGMEVVLMERRWVSNARSENGG